MWPAGCSGSDWDPKKRSVIVEDAILTGQGLAECFVLHPVLKIYI